MSQDLTTTAQPLPDFSGLRHLATCQEALQPLGDAVLASARARARGQVPDKAALTAMTLAACAVMAHTSLFKANCTTMLNGIAQLAQDPAQPHLVSRARAWTLRRTGWENVAQAAALAPELLAYRDVCAALAGAFGDRGRHSLYASDLRGYSTLLQHLDGASHARFAVTRHTRRLGAHLRDWGAFISRYNYVEGPAFPEHSQPTRLGSRAHSIGLRLELASGSYVAV